MMAQVVQHELLLGRHMSRLGTETAFDVLNKARALERQGKSIFKLWSERRLCTIIRHCLPTTSENTVIYWHPESRLPKKTHGL
jgi:hypothetical protein